MFLEVRRVLRDDGVLWVNYGDAYASGGRGVGMDGEDGAKQRSNAGALLGPKKAPPGLKPKDLIGLPWRIAFALQADGWYLRSDIIWHKPNPMPESVTDRPTKAHEYVFLLSKAARYFYDAEAIAEPSSGDTHSRRRDGAATPKQNAIAENGDHKQAGKGMSGNKPVTYRNARSVWTINPQPTPEAHFATFPEALVERCIKAGSRRGDCVIDPFAGSGTTLLVAERLGRDSIGIELNPDYVEIAKRRITNRDPMATKVVAPGLEQPSLFGDATEQ